MIRILTCAALLCLVVQKDRFKDLLVSFRSWIRLVSDVSKFGAVLVDKQIITLEDDKGKSCVCVCVYVRMCIMCSFLLL